MVFLELRIKNIQKPRFREKILGYIIAEYSLFKLGLMCYEDIPGGKVFELFTLVDRYDDYPLFRYAEVEGDVGYGTLLGQTEYFSELRKLIPKLKYYVSPWNTVLSLISYVEGKVFDSEGFKKRIAIKDNKFTRGWNNFFTTFEQEVFESTVKKIGVSFVVKVV
ncbi:MAG: hypothetical protein DRO23_07420 [Thermoprotei archaeon]|nr:MAG: hypothetical protein DRO23_07420 [Thermoprotei archaeon]